MLQNHTISAQAEWFSSWFNSPYYHMLYQDRNEAEARSFLSKLLKHLRPPLEASVLDLACGKGRHSIYLNHLGYRVTGLDLSEQNIAAAHKFANPQLQFVVHDMRQEYRPGHFSLVLNLFTSFGYFESDTDNLNVLRAIASSLKDGGKVVIDFLNPAFVVPRLVAEEEKEIGGLRFRISRRLNTAGFLEKDIRFFDKGECWYFQERVKAISHQEFLGLFKEAHLELLETFGNYDLAPYEPESSERMIFVLHKKPGTAAC